MVSRSNGLALILRKDGTRTNMDSLLHAKWNEMWAELPDHIKEGMDQLAVSMVFYAGYMAAMEVVREQMTEWAMDGIGTILKTKQMIDGRAKEVNDNATETSTVN